MTLKTNDLNKRFIYSGLNDLEQRVLYLETQLTRSKNKLLGLSPQCSNYAEVQSNVESYTEVLASAKKDVEEYKIKFQLS